MKKPKKYPNEPNMVYLGNFFKCNLIIPSSKIHLWQDLLQDFEGEGYDKLGQKDYERFSNPKGLKNHFLGLITVFFSLISGKLNKEANARFILEIHHVQMKIGLHLK